MPQKSIQGQLTFFSLNVAHNTEILTPIPPHSLISIKIVYNHIAADKALSLK
jgi:hypothetical protein